MECDGVSFGDGVGDANRLNFHFAEFEFLPWRHALEIDFDIAGSFFELHGDHCLGKGGAVKGKVEFAEEVSEGADVVLVSVGDDDATDFIAIFEYVSKVGDNNIDSVVFFVREGDSAVHDDDVFICFDDGTVFSDFASSTEGNNFEGGHRRASGYLGWVS